MMPKPHALQDIPLDWIFCRKGKNIPQMQMHNAWRDLNLLISNAN